MAVLVALADLHCHHDALDVPEGDVLVVAGDLTKRGTLAELREVNAFLAGLPHAHKLVVAGNHDACFERQPAEARATLSAATYLEDEEIRVAGLRLWGSPWQPEHLDMAFNLPRGRPLAEKWARIPAGLDVLVTHGPPHGILDRNDQGAHVGCEALRERVREIRPRVHVFGHIHEARGIHRDETTTYVNAATAGRHEAVVLELGPR